MLPFTAQDVIDAFKRHPKIKPVRHAFREKVWGDTPPEEGECGIRACCALSILLVDAGHCEAVKSAGSVIPDTIQSYCNVMGWSDTPESIESLKQLIFGFDRSHETASITNEDAKIGVEIYEAVKGLRV